GVGGEGLGRERISDREPGPREEVAEAAAEGEPAEADGRCVPKPGREAVCAGRLRVATGRGAGLRPGRTAVGVDLDRVHRAEIEHDPALAGPVPGAAVTAAAHRKLGSRLAG